MSLGVGPGVGSEGVAVAVCLLPSLCGVRVPGQLSAVTGFWSLGISFIMCPNCTCSQLLLVPYSFFVFCCWRGQDRKSVV